MQQKKGMQKRRRPTAAVMLATVVAAATIGLTPSTTVVTVDVWQAVPTTVTQTVVCAGTVQSAKETAVTAPLPLVIGTVKAAVGDTVHKGDVLMTVDREATLKNAASAGWTMAADPAVASLAGDICAPSDGVVKEVAVKSGETVAADAPLAVMSGNGEICVAVTVPESALLKVRVGQAVRVSGVALEKEYYEGTLTSLATSAHKAVGTNGSRTVVDGVVTLDPQQTDMSLIGGLSAKAAITVETQEDALVVPYDAVVDRDRQAAVYCLQGHTAYRRVVEIAGETAHGLEIGRGLQKGEWVVADAQGLSGDEVTVSVGVVLCRS